MTVSLQDWVGREQVEHDLISGQPARAAAATFDLAEREMRDGTPLDPAWHWFYFQPATRRSLLGPDGHALRGGFLPPVSLPRRMWAGGTLKFVGELRVGERAERRSRIGAIEEKSGRTGRLVFVTVHHWISGPRGLAVEEEQHLVYRDPSPGTSPRKEPLPAELAWRETYCPDAVTLFRFSALTFNGHRIHYDHPYATHAEGYPGLVVHAPLTAMILLAAAMRQTGRQPLRYAFRHVAPLFCDQPIMLAGLAPRAAETELYAGAPDQTIASRAKVEWL